MDYIIVCLNFEVHLLEKEGEIYYQNLRQGRTRTHTDLQVHTHLGMIQSSESEAVLENVVTLNFTDSNLFI